jgi:ketosteroid isomerase-like protein
MRSDQTVEQANVSHSDFDGTIEAYRQALALYMKGDPKPPLEFFSLRDDVTLANPLGPPVRGPVEVARVAAEGAAQVSDGSVRGIDEVSRYSTPDLGYVVQIERTQARLAGSADMSPIALRVTMILRREGDIWKVVHRHADPITTARAVSTVTETSS